MTDRMTRTEYRLLAAKRVPVNKYRSQRTRVGDISFASKLEAGRYIDLMLLLKAGEINSLELQPSYPLIVNGKLICTYRGDFRYLTKSGKLVLEDTKGFKTKEYRIKKLLLEALIPGLTITEIQA